MSRGGAQSGAQFSNCHRLAVGVRSLAMSTKAGCSSLKGTAVRKLSTVLDSSLVASSWAFINEIASPLIGPIQCTLTIERNRVQRACELVSD